MTRRKSDHPTRLDGQRRVAGQPLSEPPRFNISTLLEMPALDLRNFAREQCRKHGVTTIKQLYMQLEELGDACEQKGIIDQIFTKPKNSPVPPVSTSTPSGRPSMPPPPIRTSLPPAPPDTVRPVPNGAGLFSPVQPAKATKPESGAYDKTEAAESSRSVMDADALKSYILSLQGQSGTLQERIQSAESVYKTELAAAQRNIPNMKGVLQAAKQKQGIKAPLSLDEKYVLTLIELKEAIQTLRALRAQQSDLRKTSNGPDTTQQSAITDSGVQSKPRAQETKETAQSQPPRQTPPGQKRSWSVRIITDPFLDAVVVLSAVAASMHATDSFGDLARGFKKLVSFIPGSLNLAEDTEKLVAMGSFYGIALVGFGITTAVRRRQVKLASERLARMETLGERQQAAFSYAVDVLTSIRRETGILKQQASKIREKIAQDEKFMDAVDTFYPSELIWQDIMKEARLSADVQKVFGDLKVQADARYVGNLISQFLQGSTVMERRHIMGRLYANPTAKRKLGELFEKRGGNYVNRNLRERIRQLKFEGDVELQAKELAAMEEEYDQIVAHTNIIRGGEE